MKTKLAAAVAILASIGTPASAHRLDEYLQAALISVERNRVQIQLRLAPGVAVVPFVASIIDTNADGVISESEQQAYSERVIRDLSLTIDGDTLTPRLISLQFPSMEELKEGNGEILLELSANLSRNGPNRRLTFENRHLSPIGIYLVNSLVPQDPGIRLLSQNRNDSQSRYQLDYEQAGGHPSRSSIAWGAGLAVMLVLARFGAEYRSSVPSPKVRYRSLAVAALFRSRARYQADTSDTAH